MEEEGGGWRRKRDGWMERDGVKGWRGRGEGMEREG